MFQGTASDVGKSVLTTAFCRILVQDGFKTAPYKSQNMALNSYVTLCGKEIGRAQGVQAEACGIAATTDMNPILIKPTRDMSAQVVVHGKPHAEMSAWRYREEYLPVAETIVREALDRLRSAYDVVVIEGAGSPAEINLKDRDIVNMRLAGWADAPVILVADIDRGGVFASIVGTLELLEDHERSRVKGFIINKFRGDLAILQPGLDWLEQRTGLPVLGVIPYLKDIGIEAEDSVVLEHKASSEKSDAELDVAVIRLPRISNFTDTDPLLYEPDVKVRYVENPDELGNPDVILIPGTKNTLADLRTIREVGLEKAIRAQVLQGARLVGLCGGYQMLGEKLSDPEQVESEEGETLGLGYLPMETVFYPDKRTERVRGIVACSHPDWTELEGMPVEGYEIHMGRTAVREYAKSLFDFSGQKEGVISADGKIWGTYVHGIFENDAFRRSWLNRIRQDKGLPPIDNGICFRHRKKAAFDRLADHVRSHLDIREVYRITGLCPDMLDA
ncbi:cobyric acid synthase [Paenibacillus sp. HN-1]|nr:cobyric acid synthase [Paenibacillus sp. CGMCC 1.18879]MBY9083896.1 cobyric acid synthase [Paenibacillus sinensis]